MEQNHRTRHQGSQDNRAADHAHEPGIEALFGQSQQRQIRVAPPEPGHLHDGREADEAHAQQHDLVERHQGRIPAHSQ